MSDYSKTIGFIKEVFGNQEFTPLAVPVFAGNEKKYLEECIDTTGLSNYGGRIQSLLKTIGLEDRMTIPKDFNSLVRCDYTKASLLLNNFITDSQSFIKRSL